MNRLEEQLRIYMIEDALISLYEDPSDEEKKKKKPESSSSSSSSGETSSSDSNSSSSSSSSSSPMTWDQIDAELDTIGSNPDNMSDTALKMFDTAAPIDAKEPTYTHSGPTWQERQQKEKQKEEAKKKGEGFRGRVRGMFGKGKGTESSEDDKPKVTGKSKASQRMDDIRSGKGTPKVTDADADAEKPKDLHWTTKVGHGVGDYFAGAGGALLHNLGGKAFGLAYREAGIDSGMRSSPEFTDFGPKSMNIKGVQQLTRAFNPARAGIDAAQTGLASMRTKSRAKSYEKLGLDTKAAKAGAEKDIQGGLLKNFARTTADLDEPDIDKLITKAVEKRLIQRQQRVAPR